MLHAYADETGSASDPSRTHIGMGGLLARSEKWIEFDASWRSVCADEGVFLPFHMKEFASREKKSQFANSKWADEKPRRLLARLLDVIDATGAIPVGAVINVPDFNSLSKECQTRLGGAHKEPYYVAFQECTHQLALENAAFQFPPEPVSMFYAKLKKFTGEAGELWNAIQGANTLYGPLMNSFTPGDPRDLPALQAADIWAYELGRHFQYVVPNRKPHRYAFRRFVEMASGRCKVGNFFTYFDRAKLMEKCL
jgi:hypothetical protein